MHSSFTHVEMVTKPVLVLCCQRLPSFGAPTDWPGLPVCRLSAAARGAYIPSVRELKELAPGRNLGPGQLLTQLAQGKAPPLGMEDIEATIQFVDKYGEEGLIGVDDEVSGRAKPYDIESDLCSSNRFALGPSGCRWCFL